MVKIQVKCPSCLKKGFIEISEGYLKNVSRGLLSVNITKNLICLHSFIAYVDKNMKVRDYFLADFRVEMPEIVPPKEIEEEILIPHFIDVFLIILNLHATQMAYILKSIFFKKRVAIILDDLRYGSKLNSEILEFIQFITQDSFNSDVSVLSNKMYQRNRKKYKEYIVLEGNKIYKDVNNILNSKKLKVENQIIQKFLSESNLPASLIILKNEIRKVFILSESIAEFISNFEDKNKLNAKIITDYLIKNYNITLNKIHFRFSLEIAKNYFNAEIPKFERISDFLSF